MATSRFNAYLNPTQHAVGSLVSMDKYIMDVANGAIATQEMDNYSLVTLAFDAQGERTCTKITAPTDKSYLVAAKEVRFLNEPLTEFFVGTGERTRIVFLNEGLQIAVSKFTLDATATAITAGLKAHYDVASDSYLIHDGTQADFATANVKFTVLSNEANLEYTLGVPMVILEVDAK